MDQGRGLEGLAGLLLCQALGCESAQLVVDQGKELLGCPGIAPLDGREDTGQVVHRSGCLRPPRGIGDLAPGAPPGGVPSRPACMRGRLDPSLIGVP